MKRETKLLTMKDSVQKFANAISTVMNVEVMVIDEQLLIVAGTGEYEDKVGLFDAEVHCQGTEYLYAYLLRNGGFYIVESPDDPIYGPELCGELGELCCSIEYEGRPIGVFALVAFSEEQMKFIMDNREAIKEFLLILASLTTTMVAAHDSYAKLSHQANLLQNIVESMANGVIVISPDGTITRLNDTAKGILGKAQPEGFIGQKIDSFWPDALEYITKRRDGFQSHELVFKTGKNTRRVLLTSTPVRAAEEVESYILYFSDIIAARQHNYMISHSKGFVEFDSICGNSSKLQAAKKLANNVANTNSVVLITGETGVGKDMFASAIHNASERSNQPYISINCGAIPESLIESELFGYAEGSFTGSAKGGKPGKFEAAGNGTIFLDEISELPYHMQVKLLHVLQNHTVVRLGSNVSIEINARIIAATNKDLHQLCDEGLFRDDLYYRLSVIPLSIPPLRERKEDIVVLTDFFIRKYSTLLGKEITGFSSDAMMRLFSYHWPGNVRELENAVEYCINMANMPIICLDDLPPHLGETSFQSASIENDICKLKEKIAKYQDSILLNYLDDLEKKNIKKEELARQLGISRSSLYRKLKALGRS